MSRQISLLAPLLLTAGLVACGTETAPAPPVTPPVAAVPPTVTPPNGLVFSAPTNEADAAQTLTLTNEGGAAVTLSSLKLSDTTSFALTDAPTLPLTLTAGESASVGVGFSAGDVGPRRATLTVESDAAPVTVELGGLSFAGTGGDNEPSLQWILDTFALPVDVGDPNPSTTPIEDAPADGLVGEEVAAQTFEKAGAELELHVGPLEAVRPDILVQMEDPAGTERFPNGGVKLFEPLDMVD